MVCCVGDEDEHAIGRRRDAIWRVELCHIRSAIREAGHARASHGCHHTAAQVDLANAPIGRVGNEQYTASQRDLAWHIEARIRADAISVGCHVVLTRKCRHHTARHLDLSHAINGAL